MLTIAYLGNGKSTNRYHLPFSRKLTDKINIKKIFPHLNQYGKHLKTSNIPINCLIFGMILRSN